MNNTQSLFNQQYGFSQWNQADSVMHHLHCEYEVSDFPLVDSSMFACKSAVKDGNEHFVGMANEDGTLAVIDCETKEKHSTLAHNNAIFDLSWMFDQMQIVTASGDHTSKLFDFGDGDFRQVRLFCGHSRSVKTVTFRKEDSSVFATGSRDGNIILWDTRTEQHSFIGVPDRIILNSHAGKDTHTPSKSRKKTQSCMNSGIKSVTGLVFQDYNTLISCGAGDGMIKVWDLRKTYSTLKKEPLPKFTIPYTGRTAKNGFSNLVIDSSGTKLYANCLDNTIYCYNVATYNVMPVAKYTGHQNSSFYIRSSLSKNDKYLISGSSDENAYIWNLKYSEPIVKLVGHSAEVTCVAWCNSKVTPSIITCSDDMTYRIWTVCGEDCSDNIVRGKAEVLPLPKPVSRKRVCCPSLESVPKKLVWECPNCQTANISDMCENCISTSLKRKADSDLWNECKRVQTDFGPRRLFGYLNTNVKDVDSVKPLDGNDVDSMDLKSLDTALDSFKTNLKKDGEISTSPTVNLPNFVVDGTAPHLNYSPPKRKSQDWLTKMRTERKIRQEIMERSMGPQSPKVPKLELTPRSSKKRGVAASPLLRFFKVTNSSNKNDSLSCSSKTHSCNFFSKGKTNQQLSQ